MKTLNILTIDDDLDFANAMKIAIESWGHHVTLTHNWLNFMREMKPDTFDVIVADVETPTGNGLDAISFLCTDPSVQEIPKAFVTGRSDAETVRKCRNLNALYLHKSSDVFVELKSFITGVAEGASLVTA